MTTAAPQLNAQQRRWVEGALERVRPLAIHLSRQMSKVSADDLESVGNEALVKAALRFDPEAGTPFRRYAYYRVRGAMIDAARSENRAGRQRGRAQRALEASQALLQEASDRGTPETATLAERVKAAKALVEKTAAAVLMSRACDADVEAVVAAPQRDAESALLAAETKAVVRELIDELEPEPRALVKALYIEGKTMQEHASAIGKSLSTVSRRHAKVLALLAERFTQRRGAP